MTLFEKVKESLGNGKGELIEVKVIVDDPAFAPNGGDNRGSFSVGIWIDDSMVEESKRLVKLPSFTGKYKNIVFRDINLMKKIFDKTERQDKKLGGMIKIPNSLKMNEQGSYWINIMPTQLLDPGESET